MKSFLENYIDMLILGFKYVLTCVVVLACVGGILMFLALPFILVSATGDWSWLLMYLFVQVPVMLHNYINYTDKTRHI